MNSSVEDANINEKSKPSESTVDVNDDGSPKIEHVISKMRWDIHFQASFVITIIGVLSLFTVLVFLLTLIPWHVIQSNFFKGINIIEILISYRALCDAAYQYLKYQYMISLGIIWFGGLYGFISLLSHLNQYKKKMIVPATFYMMSFIVFSFSEIILFIPMFFVFFLVNEICFGGEKLVTFNNVTK